MSPKTSFETNKKVLIPEERGEAELSALASALASVTEFYSPNSGYAILCSSSCWKCRIEILSCLTW
ncbi:hypothetical protein RHMOL_Rhmol06G0056500 [Rhododendron molle]|uniref:Uncharacterized protein n=1 Tax=Rhododendron molle TaxID=49168 RepID=A0ACC0NA10_RHOML|nr:hypothetical protein RHMOL_Rhmol06G0056500 [Rhododendron molle]